MNVHRRPLAIRTASVGCPVRPIVELTSSLLSFNTPSLAAVCILLLVGTLSVSAVDSCVNDFNATTVVAKSYADLASYLANNSSDFRLIDIQQDIIVEETLQTPVGMNYELTLYSSNGASLSGNMTHTILLHKYHTLHVCGLTFKDGRPAIDMELSSGRLNGESVSDGHPSTSLSSGLRTCQHIELTSNA